MENTVTNEQEAPLSGAREQASRSDYEWVTQMLQMKMFGLETKMQLLVASALRPVVSAQTSQLEQVSAHEQMVQQHDEQLRRLKEALVRSAKTTSGEEAGAEAEALMPAAARDAADLARLEKKIAAMAEVQRLDRQRNETTAADLRGVAAAHARALRWAETNMEQVAADVKKLALSGTSIYQIQDMMDKYKSKTAATVRDYAASVDERLLELQKAQKRVANESEQTTEKYERCAEELQKTEQVLNKVQMDLDDVMCKNQEFATVFQYKGRIEGLEAELRSLRNLTQQNILSQHAAMKNALCRRDVEAAALHVTSEMLDHCFGPENLAHKKDNRHLESQIQINLAKWKMQAKARLDLAAFVEEPEGHSMFGGKPLETVGALRREWLKNSLNARLVEKPGRLDAWGKMRRGSADDRNGGADVRPQKRLEGLVFVEQEFIVTRPKGYEPKYLRPLRTVVFVEESSLAGVLKFDDASVEDEQKAEVELTGLQKMLQQSTTGKTAEEQQAAEAQARRRQEARSRARQLAEEEHRQRQRLTYEKEAREAREEAEHEYWNGQKIPKHSAVVKKRTNILRQNSHEGRRPEQLLVSGETFKPLFKPYREPVEGKQRGQEENSQESRDSEVARRTKLQSTTLDMHRMTAIKQRKRMGGGRADEPEMIRWGRQSIVRQPVAPRGMQFVDVDNIADLHDLDEFRMKQGALLQQDFEERVAGLDGRVQRQLEEYREGLSRYIDEKKQELSNEQKDMLQQLGEEMLRKDAEQQGSITKISEGIDDALLKVRTEIGQRFYEQRNYNDDVDQRLRLIIKKIVKSAANFDLELAKLRGVNNDIIRDAKLMDEEFKRILDVIVTMVEAHFLGNLLDLQDEVDKHSTSLWAIGDNATMDDEIREKLQQEKKGAPLKRDGASLVIDEDCLSCTLGKYRPMVKEAFKMACIQYRPSAVPFRGSNYPRRQMVDLKEDLLTNSWDLAIRNISHLQNQYGLEVAGSDPFRSKFLDKLDTKLQYLSAKSAPNSTQTEQRVIDNLLLDQVLKNNSNMSYIFESTGELEKLEDFRQSVFNQLPADSPAKNVKLQQSWQQLENLKMIDRKTQSVIDKLKNQTSKKLKNQVSYAHETSSAEEEVEKMGCERELLQPKRLQVDLRMSSKAIMATQRSSQLLKAAPSSTKHGVAIAKPKMHLGSARSQFTKSVSPNQASVKVGDSVLHSNSLLHIQSMVPAKFEQSPNRRSRDSINTGSGATGDNYFQGPEAQLFTVEGEDEPQEKSQLRSFAIGDLADIQILESAEPRKAIRPTNQSSLPEIKIYRELMGKQMPFLIPKMGALSSQYSKDALYAKGAPHQAIKRRGAHNAKFNAMDDFNPESELEQGPVSSSISFMKMQTASNNDLLQQVMSSFDVSQKAALISSIKNQNTINKKLDNQAIIKGSTKNLSISSIDQLQQSAHGKDPKSSPFGPDKAHIQGNGYLYSQGLIDNLRSPFGNPFKNPLGNIEQRFENKNKDIQQMGELIAILKTTKMQENQRQAQYRHARKSPVGATSPVSGEGGRLQKQKLQTGAGSRRSKRNNSEFRSSQQTLRGQHLEMLTEPRAGRQAGTDQAYGLMTDLSSRRASSTLQAQEQLSVDQQYKQYKSYKRLDHELKAEADRTLDNLEQRDNEFFFPAKKGSEVPRTKKHLKANFKFRHDSTGTQENLEHRSETQLTGQRNSYQAADLGPENYLEALGPTPSAIEVSANINADMGEQFGQYQSSYQSIQHHLSSYSPRAHDPAQTAADHLASNAPRPTLQGHPAQSTEARTFKHPSKKLLTQDPSRKSFAIKAPADAQQPKASKPSRVISTDSRSTLAQLAGFEPGQGGATAAKNTASQSYLLREPQQ